MTSLMSTELRPGSDLDRVIRDAPSPEEITNSDLLEKYQRLKKERKQERFYYVAVIALLLDILLLSDKGTVLSGFVLAVEGTLLLSLADKWGVNQVCDWTQKGLDLAHKRYDSLILKFSKK